MKRNGILSSLVGWGTERARTARSSIIDSRRAFVANLTVVGYTASLMLSSAAPVLADAFNDGLKPAPAIESLPIEPDTQFDAVRWYDEWWRRSVDGMANIPAAFVKDMQGTYSALKSVFNNGVRVGNVLIVRGGPDAGRILKYHAKQVGVHYLDTIRMMPDHFVKAGGRFVTAGQSIGRAAAENARHTGRVATEEGKRIVDVVKETGETMGSIGKWMGGSYKRVARETVGDLEDDAKWTGSNVRDSVNWTRDELVDAYQDTGRWMSEYADADVKLAKELADWTARQAPEGYRDTVAWTGDAAKATGRWTKAAANWTADNTAGAARYAGERISDKARQWKRGVAETHEAMTRAGDATQAYFEREIKAVAKDTFGRIPGVVTDEVASTKKHAKWLWKKGYEEGLKGGFELAGDNYFAGDVEGIAVGTFYSVAAVAQGVAYVLVLEPLAFTGHVGMGVTKTVGLATAGVVGTGAMTGLAIAGNTGVRMGGAALTMGVAALGGVDVAGQAAMGGLHIGGTAAAGGLYTAGSAVVGGMYTAGAASAGALRTVGGMAAGGISTVAVAGPGLVGGELALLGAGAVRMAGTTLAGTALTAGSLALGGLRMAGDAAYGTVKMVGITALGGVGEVLVPAFGTAVTGFSLARIAGTAVVDNVILTPAVATYDILTALTLGGWDLARDPVLGTYHLVAGVTGFSYRLAGLGSALALTAAAGALYAVAKAPLSLVFYGGMWTIAAGGKLLDNVTAPFKFERQNKWKDERRPQLEEILGVQARSVRQEIGDQVTYIRVIFSGVDRGKVNFFSTEKDGKKFKFRRVVQGNCLVVYKSKDTPIVLDSRLYEKRCLAERK